MEMSKDRTSANLFSNSDSDWADEVEMRKSTGGYSAHLSGCLASWRLYKQRCVAASNTEAENVV